MSLQECNVESMTSHQIWHTCSSKCNKRDSLLLRVSVNVFSTCIHVDVYVHVYVYNNVIRICICIICVYMHVYMYMSTIEKNIYVCNMVTCIMHTHIPMYAHVRKIAYQRMHSYIHVHSNACIYIYIYIYIYRRICVQVNVDADPTVWM